MAANYPSSLPVKDAAGANLSTNPHSALHDDMYDEIVAIGTELGTNPKGTAATVKARLDLIDVGAWTSHTPAIGVQGGTAAVSSTSYSKYTRVGRTVTWNFRFDTSGTGSAGTAVLLGLPVTAASAAGVVGTGYIETGGTYYSGTWQGSTTTNANFYADRATGVFGVNPSVALQPGDLFVGQLIYEAAA